MLICLAGGHLASATRCRTYGPIPGIPGIPGQPGSDGLDGEDGPKGDQGKEEAAGVKHCLVNAKSKERHTILGKQPISTSSLRSCQVGMMEHPKEFGEGEG